MTDFNYDVTTLLFIFNPQTGLALTGPLSSGLNKQPLEWQNYSYSNERQRWAITKNGFLHYVPLRDIAMGWDLQRKKFYAMNINDPMCNINWKIDDMGFITCKYGSLGTVTNNSKILPEVGRTRALKLIAYSDKWNEIVRIANKQGFFQVY